jgi:hypothetical protein
MSKIRSKRDSPAASSRDPGDSAAGDAPVANVSYELAVDGALYRDVDQIRPALAGRWRAGDTIRILYLPDFRTNDSVIISTD